MSAVVAVRQILGEGYGASEVAACLGLSRWQAPIQKWMEKTGRAKPAFAGEPAGWGTKLEPLIRAEYIERHGVEVRIPKQSEYHPEVSWARATVDGYVYAPDELLELVKSHLLEVKAPGLRMADDWGDEDERCVPEYYLVQAVWQMWITGMRRVDFAVLLGGQQYFEVTVHHDPQLEADVIEGVTEFKRLVDTDTPPAADETEAHAKYLRSKIKNHALVVDAPADLDAMVQRWRDLVQASKRIENDEALLKNQILERCVALGAGKLKTSVGRIGVSLPGTRSNTDYKALVTDLCTRLQLRGESVAINDEIARVTKITPTDGSLRRPNHWTKED